MRKLSSDFWPHCHFCFTASSSCGSEVPIDRQENVATHRSSYHVRIAQTHRQIRCILPVRTSFSNHFLMLPHSSRHASQSGGFRPLGSCFRRSQGTRHQTYLFHAARPRGDRPCRREFPLPSESQYYKHERSIARIPPLGSQFMPSSDTRKYKHNTWYDRRRRALLTSS